MSQLIKAFTTGMVYQHYKGSKYLAIALAHHTETEEPLAIYKSLDGTERYWARPLYMFFETVEHNSKKVPRFIEQSDNIKGTDEKNEINRNYCSIGHVWDAMDQIDKPDYEDPESMDEYVARTRREGKTTTGFIDSAFESNEDSDEDKDEDKDEIVNKNE